MSPCSPNPCLNDGSCTVDIYGEASCTCNGEWTGCDCSSKYKHSIKVWWILRWGNICTCNGEWTVCDCLIKYQFIFLPVSPNVRACLGPARFLRSSVYLSRNTNLCNLYLQSFSYNIIQSFSQWSYMWGSHLPVFCKKKEKNNSFFNA